MLKHYLKIASRHLLKHKVYAGINVAGLAVGLGCCLLIVLYLRFELGYDRHHEHADRIVRVVSERQVGGALEEMANVPFPTGPALAATFPEIVESARVFRATNGSGVRYEDHLFPEALFYFVDPAVFDVFTFEFVSGTPASALQTPTSVVISERAAEKYFGSKDPLGQTFSVAVLGDPGDLVVSGVVKDAPAASHFDFDFLVPFESELNGWNAGEARWDTGMLGAWTYLLLSGEDGAAALAAKLPAFAQAHLPPAVQERLSFSLQPLTDIHLASHRVDELGTNGSLLYLYLFAGIALLVLLIACVNFVNLSTAQSIRRAKEVGVYKSFGANRKQLVGQYLGEAYLLSFAAVVLAVGFVELALPLFRSAIGKPLPSFILRDPAVVAALVGMWLGTGLLSGLYPAFVMARVRPSEALKGGGRAGQGRQPLRSGLIVGQFAVALVLLVTFGTIFDQLDYIKRKALGFDQEQLAVITSRGEASFEALKHELKQSPAIVDVTVTGRVPGGRLLPSSLVTPQGSDRETRLQVPFLKVEQDFLRTFALELKAGRDFAPDDQHAAIVNEAAVQAFGWQGDVLGKEIARFARDGEEVWRVVGVIEDAHFESLHTAVKPLILAGGINSGSRAIVRVGADDLAGGVAHLEQTWARLNPATPLDFYFLDDDLDRLYAQEERLSTVVQGFTVLALLIACMGLFGLIAFSTEQRTKEMGIRKVLGASVLDILALLSREFLALVALAALVAVPVAYYVVDRWLDAFAYRVDVSGVTFLYAGGLVLLATLLIVGLRSAKVASLDPVETLRYE